DAEDLVAELRADRIADVSRLQLEGGLRQLWKQLGPGHPANATAIVGRGAILRVQPGERREIASLPGFGRHTLSIEANLVLERLVTTPGGQNQEEDRRDVDLF